jgi:hypothetical protein
MATGNSISFPTEPGDIDLQIAQFASQEFYGQAARTISTGKLRASQRFHTRPINVVISHGPSGGLRPGEI